MLTSLLAVLASTNGYGSVVPEQFFALLSTDGDYAAAVAALPSPVTLGAASHDANLNIIAARVTERQINTTAALANLRKSVYPTTLCRHRWTSFENFKALGGYHMLGESENSFERTDAGATMAGRSMLFIRPQQNAGDGTGDNYGNGDGTTHYDALNGPQDPAIDAAALGDAVWNKGTSYVICDGAHVRWGDIGAGGNPDQGNGVVANGLMAVEDATAAAANKIFVYWDWDMMPGMFWGGYTLWETFSNLPWEEYTTGIYVNGYFSDNGTTGASLGAGSTQALPEADIDDLTQSGTELLKRHILKGQASLSNLTGNPGRFYSMGDGSSADWDAVHTWNTSTFSDVTTAANDATADDFEILAASAPDESAVYFGSSALFSTIRINLSQVQVGGTGVWEYSQGSSTWTTFTNIDDNSSGFTANTSEQSIQFNPKSDWATDTVNGDTLYWVRWRKTGGTVTTSARGDQSRKRAAAMFIHRWNSSAPTRGLCHYDTGLRFDLNGKGNVEFVRARFGPIAQHTAWATADDVTVTGGQYLRIGAMAFTSGSYTRTWRAGSYGTRYWDISDHEHTTKDDPFIQGIIERVYAGMAAGINEGDHGVTPNPNAFDDLDDWCDFLFVGNGPYGSGSSNWTHTYDGMKVRWPGGSLNNDSGDTVVSVGTTDDHGFAHYGNHDGANDTYKRMAVEKGRSSIDFYASATGNNDAPVSGSSNAMKNFKLSHGYCSGVGNADAHEPYAIIFENDADVGEYDDGTGGNSGNQVYFWGAKDQRDTGDNAGSAFKVVSSDSLHTFRYNYVDNPGNEGAFSTNGGFSNNGPRSTNAVTFDGTATYNDITSNLIDSGNTATELFAAGTAGNILYMGELARHCRKYTFNIPVAGVGGPTLVWEYHNGSSWTSLSVTDGTSGLTATGTVTWNRPTDAATVSVNGSTKYWVRIRIASGSFSTIPQADEIGTYQAAGSIDFQYNRIKNVDVASGCRVGHIRHGVGTALVNSGIWIDDNNIIELGAGQSSATEFWNINGVAAYALAAYQALSKPKLTTDALQDSVFGDNYTLE